MPTIQPLYWAKHAIFLLLHVKMLENGSKNAKRHREYALQYYNTAISQLQWCDQSSWGVRVIHLCAVYFSIFEAIEGNKKGAEEHNSFLLASDGKKAYDFLCFFTSLLPP